MDGVVAVPGSCVLTRNRTLIDFNTDPQRKHERYHPWQKTKSKRKFDSTPWHSPPSGSSQKNGTLPIWQQARTGMRPVSLTCTAAVSMIMYSPLLVDHAGVRLQGRLSRYQRHRLTKAKTIQILILKPLLLFRILGSSLGNGS